ncbi:MAG: hypothetical protein A2Z17_02895 [Gammaproteobacteria bacterium RBG_16_66_13]|nr:MAG: hypothetical protein A2Z17_02895 [Gammaproteobacteria bacterium RBG_16_66_13]
MKTVGVLGGLGPQATMDFEARFHQAAQRLIPQLGNSGFPPMVVFYLRHPAVVMGADLKPVQPVQPDPRLLRAAEQLGALADFLVITANAPHLFQDHIEQASGKPVLSMIEVTLEEVQRRTFQTVGLLGFGEPVVYQVPLDRLGIPNRRLPAELRDRLDQAIWAVWEGRETAEDRDAAAQAVDYLRNQGADILILGCTEIPLLLGEQAEAPDLINPAQLLAEAAVRAAIQPA